MAITIAWIAPSAQQASELISTWLASSNTPTPTPGGYIVNDGTINGSDDRALIAAGRAIVEVTVPNHTADARALAPVIASELRAAYG